VPKALTLLWSNPARERIEGMRPKLYRMAYAWCHDAHLADDLTQEALAKALGHAGQLRDGGALCAWLFAILNNCWRDYLRSRREFSDVDELDEVIFDPRPGPDGDYERHQTCQRVRAAIAALPLAQRQVITLVDIEGYSYADVARILEVPVGSVMSRLSRARQALKSHLLAQEPANRRSQLRRVK
jgi:RNA polymerase sigma-70 factor (ECF subfamily)